MFLFYIDDSGQIDYNQQANKYFVFNALGFDSSEWQPINQQIVSLKQSIFKTPNAELLEIKSNWLRIPREREKHWYLKELEVSELKNLTNSLYNIVLNNNITLIASVINKDNMLKKYGQKAYKPNIYAMELLLERISLFMNENHPDKQAIIIADKCSNDIEGMLNDNHVKKRNKSGGGYTWKNLQIIIENILFADSKYSNFIQLTDLCAYNIFHAFQYNKPKYEYFQKILPKYHSEENGVLLNYGIVYQPSEKKETNSDTLNFLQSYKKTP